MVVIKGFGGQPMMLLISPEINSRETDLWFIVFAYLRRWGIEDTANFANRLMSENDNQVVLYSFNKTVNL
ncbi:MAG: hypothetical protein MUO72_18840 [Bacteroidales bacterium]|nr:hypothetical protein [Bacteroidales bacterium]